MQSSVSVLQSKHLADAILSGNADAVKARVEALQESMSVINMLAIDKDNEQFSFAGRTITGAADAVGTTKERLIAATGIPESLLFGSTQGGLNSGENAGETRTWYAHVASEQEARYRPALHWMLSLIAAADGITAPWSFEFRPLWEPDEAPKAATRKANADARAVDLAAQLLSPDEARANDPSMAEAYPTLEVAMPAAGESPLLSFASGSPSPLLGARASEDPAAGEGDLGPDALPESEDQPPEGESLVGIRQAAETIGVSPRSIRSWVRSGDVRAWRPGARYQVLVSEVRSALAGARVTPFGPGGQPPEPESEGSP
jgi:hypothetical protein